MSKTNPKRDRAIAMFEVGREDADAIAAEVGVHRATVFRWISDWREETAERAREQAEREQISVLRLGFGDLWRWSPQHRARVLATFKALDDLLVVRDPAATAPPDFDAVEVLQDLTMPALDDAQGALHGASEVATASSTQSRVDPNVA